MRVTLEHSTDYQSIVSHPTATAIQGWYLSQGAGKWHWVATLGLISKDCFLEAGAAFCEKGVLWGTGLSCVLAIMAHRNWETGRYIWQSIFPWVTWDVSGPQG